MSALAGRVRSAAADAAGRARVWLTPVRAVRLVAAAVPVLLLTVSVVRGARGPHIPHYALPEGATATTTAPAAPPPPGVVPVVDLASVDGTTTTAPPPMTGRATLGGTVAGPQGAVAGAVVRVERLVGDMVITTDVVAAVDGTWTLPNVPGGRYRLRAFLPPFLAQTEPEIRFVEGDEQSRADLTVEQFGSPQVAAAVAPDPPVTGEPLHLTVQVSQGVVEPNGLVVHRPLPGWSVEVQSAGAWTVAPPLSAFVDGAGRATFLMTCRTAGANQVQLVLRSLTTPAVVPATVEVPACVAPAPTTETTPSSSSSSSTSLPGPPTTG